MSVILPTLFHTSQSISSEWTICHEEVEEEPREDDRGEGGGVVGVEGEASLQLNNLIALSEFIDQITTEPSTDPEAKNVPKRKSNTMRENELK